MSKNFSKKVVFITGAGKGIGRTLTESLLSKGAYIYALTRSKYTMQDFKKNNNIKIFYGDVSNIKLIKKIFKTSIKDKRKINSIVNNAGIRQRKKFTEISKQNIKEIFDINFFSIFEILKLFVNYVKKNNISSSVVNIGSIVGEVGFKDLSGYSSTKGALKSLTQCLALEYIKKNIRFNLVSPGFVATSYFNKFKKKRKLYKWTLSKIPMKRWGKSQEISELVAFLLSDNSYYITGETINIDGGWING